MNLKNFKSVDNTFLTLEGKSVIFFGVNGVGKTTILTAVNILYSGFINTLLKNPGKNLGNLDILDIQSEQTCCTIEGEFMLEDPDAYYTLSRSISKLKQTPSQDQQVFTTLCQEFYDRYLKPIDMFGHTTDHPMPIYVNYGVHRSASHLSFHGGNDIPPDDKRSIFADSLNQTTDFSDLFHWFRNQEDYENEQKVVQKNLAYVNPALQAVRTAMTAMLDGVKNLRIQRKPLAMKIDKEGISLSLQQLSDGEICTLSLFGDLARRLSIANPNLANPLEGSGVVLIDEIELHMHPAWQRKILKTLQKTFPNIQFLITTHSPQVLGEVDDHYLIYEINRSDGRTEYHEIPSLKGWDTNSILDGYMHVSSVNAETKALIKNMYLAIEKQDYNLAEKYVKELEALTDTVHEDAVKANILIRKGRRRIEKNNQT